MAQREIKDWITVNHQHIPIFEGQSKQDAIDKAKKHQKSVNDDEDKKQKQIAENKQQADEKNNSKEQKITELKQQLENAKGLKAKVDIKRKIEMLDIDWKGTEEEYKEYKHKKLEAEDRQRKLEYEKRQEEHKKEEQAKENKRKAELENELKTQPKNKVEQFKIIQDNNPMLDDYHIGIRKPSDIKTWEEAIKDSDSFTWGDFSRRDAERALKEGSITIYSSYPIKQGVFVSTSKIQSEHYAGGEGKKVYSKKVPLEDVAWINGDEGQFAKLKREKK